MGEVFSKIISSKSGQNPDDSKILEKITDVYVQRHAASCANVIEKVFGKNQKEKSKYAPDSGISYVGVQQCLQVCDYFSNFRIDDSPKSNSNSNSTKKPLVIFCCSELARTHQTLFLSWLKYLKEYKKNNGKIIVLPWLNEVAVIQLGYTFNTDNYPINYNETKRKWDSFIQELKNKQEEISKDTLNNQSDLSQIIEQIPDVNNWDELFYLSSVIYNKTSSDPLSNRTKKVKIKRKGIIKEVGDMEQFTKMLPSILAEYLNKHGIILNEYGGIKLVIVGHHNSDEKFIEFLNSSSLLQFKEQQLVNCEVVRLPGKCLLNPGQNNEVMERIFPTQFNTELNIQIDSERINVKRYGKKLSIKRKTFVNPLFILYMSNLKLFLSVNNIVKTRLKARFENGSGFEKKSHISKKRLQVKKPLFKFLWSLTLEEYRSELENAKRYIEQLKAKYEGKQTFYDYSEMISKIQEKIGFLDTFFWSAKSPLTSQDMKNKSPLTSQDMKNKSINRYIQNKKNKNITMNKENISKELKNYLFSFCIKDSTAIDSIAVF